MTKARRAKQEEIQDEFTSALHTMRLLVKEVGGNYLAGLQADVARAEHAAGQSKASTKQLAQMAGIVRLINQLDVKPQKGRRRDLKALDKLIGKINDTVDSW
jgi:hypothetical protein